MGKPDTIRIKARVNVGGGHVMGGVGYGKAKGVPAAIAKGVEEARKGFFRVPMIGNTITHPVQGEAAAGVVMLRPRLALSKYWTFSPTLSVGAGDSDLVWEMAPAFVYDCCGTEFRFGYRNLNYDLENGNDSADISISGPVIGVGFAF